MSTELWVAILTFLTACTGIGRWLIHVYWSQARQISQLTKSNQAQFALRIEGAISDHKRLLDSHARELVEVSERLLKIQSSLAKNTEQNAANTKLLSDYIETTAAKFSKLEVDLINLKNGMMLVRGKPRGEGN